MSVRLTRMSILPPCREELYAFVLKLLHIPLSIFFFPLTALPLSLLFLLLLSLRHAFCCRFTGSFAPKRMLLLIADYWVQGSPPRQLPNRRLKYMSCLSHLGPSRSTLSLSSSPCSWFVAQISAEMSSFESVCSCRPPPALWPPLAPSPCLNKSQNWVLALSDLEINSKFSFPWCSSEDAFNLSHTPLPLLTVPASQYLFQPPFSYRAQGLPWL